MVFSIPQPIYPAFTVPNSGPVHSTLNVGTAVKDLPQGAETAMKKTTDLAVIRARENFQAESAQYDRDFQAATIRGAEAEKSIGASRTKKAIAITLLVASIIGAVGAVVAAVLTQTWPIAFIAAPFLIGMAPASYFTHIFRKAVSMFESEIAAPGALHKPVLNLPIYNAKRDLDLLQSRIDVQNALSSMTVQQLSNSGKTNDEIVSYALLDRVTPVKAEKRPVFYAKAIQLINAYGQIVSEFSRYSGQAQGEFSKLDRELREWKSQQDSYIQTQEWNIREQERIQIQIAEARRRGEPLPVNTFGGRVSTFLNRWQLDKMKADVSENYGRRDAQNRSWLQATIQNVNGAFSQASTNLDAQYAAAKSAAV